MHLLRSAFAAISRLFKYDLRFRFAFIVLVCLIVFAFLSLFSPYDPRASYYAPINHPPSFRYLFGTNGRGQDLFWLLTYAMKNSLIFSLEVALISRVIAIIVGITAGYKRGVVDQILVLLSDSFIILPLLPILIFLKLIMREMSFSTLALVLSFFGWPWDARLIRSQILSLRERTFTYSAIFSGRNLWTMIFSDYLPHILPITLATTVNNMLWSLGFEITLSILGLTPLDIPTMGTVTYWAIQQQAMVMGIWWWLTFPIGLLVLLFIALYFLFVSVTDYINPKARIMAK